MFFYRSLVSRVLHSKRIFSDSEYRATRMDFTESKLSTTPFSINDILTSNNQQSLSKKLKQFCRFRRSSLDCFIVSKDDQSSSVNDNSDKNYLQIFNNNNNPLDMRCRHSDLNVSGNWLSVDISVSESTFHFVWWMAISVMTLWWVAWCKNK